MDAKTRDELLIRIDERLKAIKDGDEGDIPEIKESMANLNSKVSKNTTFRKVGTWIGGILFIALLTLAGNLMFGG